jgi:hypothetical protein
VVIFDKTHPPCRHPGEGRDPFPEKQLFADKLLLWKWIPASAGMTKKGEAASRFLTHIAIHQAAS